LRDNATGAITIGQMQLGNLQRLIGECLERRFAAVESEAILREPFVSHVVRHCEGMNSWGH
jgi:hypothetical protein